jgi:NADH dehydrogenase
MKILVIGSSGFVGSHVMNHLKSLDAKLATFLRRGEIDNDSVQSYRGDITNPRDLEHAMELFRPDIVVHLVGIIKEKKPDVTFQNIHVEGTKNIVQSAKKFGIKKIIYISALGAAKNAATEYYKTKFEAEQIIRDSGLDYTILRPSLMFGKGAGFTNMLAKQLRLPLPFCPLIGDGAYPFMPVAVDITATVIAQAAEGKALKKTVDIVGPQELSLKTIQQTLKTFLKIKKPDLPFPIVLLRFATIFSPLGFPLSAAQLKMITEGNTGDKSDMQKFFVVDYIYFSADEDYPLL